MGIKRITAHFHAGLGTAITLWRQTSWADRAGIAIQLFMIPLAIGANLMQGRTHLLAGIATGLALATGLDILPALAVVGAAAIGALTPDIDHPNSIAGRRAGIVGGAVRLAFSHRGALHSGVAAAIVFVAALALPYPFRTFGMAFAGGYTSHLVLDMLTGAGIPLFWPGRGRVSLLPLRTGGVIEMIFSIGLLVAIGWLVLEWL